MMRGLFKPGSYRDVFLDADDRLSAPSKTVIKDLMNYTRYYDDKIAAADIMRYQGRQDVLNRIIGMLNIQTEDVAMFRGKGELDGLV